MNKRDPIIINADNFKLNYLKEKEETVATSERSHNLEKALLATIQHRL